MGDVKVHLPDGCEGVQVGGRTYTGRAGTHAMVPEQHARLIESADTGGILSGQFKVTSLGTKRGRWCKKCAPPRLWNAWNAICPRCGAATEPE